LPDGLNLQSHPETEIHFGPREAAPRGVQLTLGLPNPHPENFSICFGPIARRSQRFDPDPERRGIHSRGGSNRDGGGGEAMEKPLPEPAPSAAAEEVAERFRSLVDLDDVASIRQTQHLM